MHIFKFCYSVELFFSIFLSGISLTMSRSTVFLKSVLGNNFGKTGEDGGLKICTDVGLHEEQDSILQVVGFLTTSAMGVANPDQFQHFLHDPNLNCGFSSDFEVIKVVIIHKESVPVPYAYELHNATMDEVLETL